MVQQAFSNSPQQASAQQRADTYTTRVDGRELKFDLGGLHLPTPEAALSPLLRSFPTQDKLPGSARVESVVEPENAKYRLVHIRQNHYLTLHRTLQSVASSPEYQESSAEQIVQATLELLNEVHKRGNVDEIQASIHTILSHLVSEHGIRSVYSEGQTIERGTETARVRSADIDELVLETAKQLYSVAAANEKLHSNQPGGARERFRAVAFDAAAQIDDVSREKREAVTRLSMDGSLNLLPSDSAQLKDAYHQAILEQSAVNEAREDLLLQIAARLEANGDRVAIVVYGSDHKFEDNIRRFNDTNPKGRFALIVVDPIGL